MKIERRAPRPPWFSICIPQFNRTSFLIESLRSIARQSFTDFEVCISDDCSTDGREGEVTRFLNDSGLAFAYSRRETNGRYDANLRSALALAQGRFAFLLGNDDALYADSTLDRVFRAMQPHDRVGVVLTNYQSADDRFIYHRIQSTGILGRGPLTAARHYRDLSFVSGVCLRTDRAQAHATDRWDGSEMYQTYLACRLMAEGEDLLGLEDIIILRGIQLPGEEVDSYAKQARKKLAKPGEIRLPLTRLAPLVANAIEPYLDRAAQRRINFLLSRELVAFTYLYWLFDYRKVASWRYATRIAWTMRPASCLKGISFRADQRAMLSALYLAVTAIGLTFPASLFFRLYPRVYRWVKSRYAATEPAPSIKKAA